MNRRRASRSRSSAAPAKPRAVRWLPGVVVALVLALPAVWLVSRTPRRHPGVVDPLAAIGVAEAHERGMDLARGGDPLGAVPYFRRVMELRPDSWNAHENLAGALGNGVMQARKHLGHAEIGTRSSVERVAMMREALRHTEVAESLAQTPTDRATVLFERGRALRTWGYPVEALVFLRLAYTSAPNRPEIEASLREAQDAFLTGGRSGP